jgi:hypothetical protein
MAFSYAAQEQLLNLLVTKQSIVERPREAPAMDCPGKWLCGAPDVASAATRPLNRLLANSIFSMSLHVRLNVSGAPVLDI